MSDINNLYVIEWMGPYNDLDEMFSREDTDFCRIYLITGRLPYEQSIGIKYVGITSRKVYKRLKEKDHIEKQKSLKEKQYWVGRFSVNSSNNLSLRTNRLKAELVESLLIRYLSTISDSKMINDKKKRTDPRKPVVVISRGQQKYSDKARKNKPNALSQLPDVLMFTDQQYFVSDKLRCVIDNSITD